MLYFGGSTMFHFRMRPSANQRLERWGNRSRHFRLRPKPRKSQERPSGVAFTPEPLVIDCWPTLCSPGSFHKLLWWSGMLWRILLRSISGSIQLQSLPRWSQQMSWRMMWDLPPHSVHPENRDSLWVIFSPLSLGLITVGSSGTLWNKCVIGWGGAIKGLVHFVPSNL